MRLTDTTRLADARCLTNRSVRPTNRSMRLANRSMRGSSRLPTLLSTLTVAALGVAAPLAAAAAQTESARRGPLELPTAPVAALPVALYTAQANVQEASDSSKSGLATEVLLSRLGEQLGQQLRPADRVAAAAAGSGEARGLSGDQPCNVIVACARLVGKTVGARWVVMAKVSKTSNLIWLFTGQLIRFETGEIVLDDSTELKGDPEQMVRVGTRIFADRVARVVRNGGVVTNFPTPPGPG
jgi:Protein of unknown function (DUF2380)